MGKRSAGKRKISQGIDCPSVLILLGRGERGYTTGKEGMLDGLDSEGQAMDSPQLFQPV